jgi:surfactin synthase thioesterase subunit
MSALDRWFPYRKATGSVELFAFPHTGAASTVFTVLRGMLEPDGIALTAAVLPGHGRRVREEPHRSIDTLLADFQSAAEQDGWALFQDEYALMGHCFGGLICYELARLLVRAPCRDPRLLVVCHCPPPPLMYDSGMSRMPTEELLARTAAMGGTPAALLADPDFRTVLERPLRADWTLSDEYVHQPSEPLPVPMLAVCGADDPFVEATDLPLWGEHTAALFRTAEVGAGHWSLAADAAGALAAEVRSALAAARAG